MPSNKISKNAKARPATKPPATKTPQPKAAGVATPRATSKQATVIALLNQPWRNWAGPTAIMRASTFAGCDPDRK